MGFFDLLSPVLSWFDNLVSPFTNEFVRITFWALVSALITSLVFKKLSNPDKISSLKTDLKAKQKELNNHDGEFSEIKDLAIDTMKLSIKRMGLTFMPAMLASIPIIFVLTYLSNNYGLMQPNTGDPIPIQVTWEQSSKESLISIVQDGKTLESGEINSINWPSDSKAIELVEKQNSNILIQFPSQLSSIIHKKQWWNSLIGNPIGYLNDDSNVSHIEFAFKNNKIIEIGPEWMHGWLFVFFFMTILFSIVFLFIFKIKF